MSYYDSFSSQYQGTPLAVIYYTCPWTVTPGAKDQLDVSLTAEIEGVGLAARLSYDHDKHIFKIECPPEEKAMVFRMFSRVIDIFLKEQVGQTVEKESTLATKIGPIPFGVQNEAKEAADEVLLQGFLKSEWSCPRIEQLGGVFVTKLLRRIGELTECTLTYNFEARKITVVGPNQEACHGAILKLDKVRDYEVPLFNNPYPNQVHLFYAEEHTEFSPVPTPLKKVHALYENTLLDISAFPPTRNSPYQTLSEAITLRCALFDTNNRAFRTLPIPKEVKPAIKKEQTGAEYKVFFNHQFAEKGDVDPVVGVVEDVELMVGEVGRDIALEKKAGIEVWVRGVEGDGPLLESIVGEEKPLISPVKEELGERSPAAGITGSTSSRDKKKGSRGSSPAKVATAMNAIPPHLRGLFGVSDPGPTPQRGSLLDMDIEDNLPLTLQPLSLLPSAPTAPTTLATPISPSTPASFFTQPTTNSPQPLIETLQATSELSTRTYHQTMNLQATPGSSNSKGYWRGSTFIRAPPTPALSSPFMISLRTATGPLLRALRGWRGSASLEVKIGRIWIASAALGLSDSDSRGAAFVEGRRMAKWLESGRRADMSLLVTEEAGDVELLVDMKLFGQDKGFWNKKPKWGIEYLFSCVDPRDVGGEGGEEGRFMVRVDAETFRWKCNMGDRCLGETWVHCLKNVWDLKVCATGRQEVVGEYAEWAAELVEGLYISPNKDTKNLSLSFSLPAPHALSFPTIRIARKCTYASTTGTTLLHIAEMHDLLVERVGSSLSGSIVYRASVRPDRGDSHQEVRWFEVSLSGKGWEEMLAEEVEVGGERRMGELKGVEDVVGTAAAVVRGMEGVGGWNESPFGGVLREQERREREAKRSGGKGGRVR